MLNNRGETMMEMIISIAIFAMLITLITTIFTTSNRMQNDTYDARVAMNARLAGVSGSDGSVESVTISEHEISLTNQSVAITYSSSSGATGSFNVILVKDGNGTFAKYVK